MFDRPIRHHRVNTMATIELKVAPTEHELLVRLLENALDETRTELHRTHFSPTFRDQVKDEARLLQKLLERFQQAALHK